VEGIKPRLFDGRHWEDAMQARQEAGDARDVTGA
jgi:hypothetical protein